MSQHSHALQPLAPPELAAHPPLAVATASGVAHADARSATLRLPLRRQPKTPKAPASKPAPRLKHRRRRRHDDAPAPPLHAQSLISLYGATSAVAPAGETLFAEELNCVYSRSNCTCDFACPCDYVADPSSLVCDCALVYNCTCEMRSGACVVGPADDAYLHLPGPSALRASYLAPAGGDLWRLDFSRTRNFTLEAWVRPGALLGDTQSGGAIVSRVDNNRTGQWLLYLNGSRHARFFRKESYRGADSLTSEPCKDSSYPHKHPTLDLCYSAAGWKEYQASGGGSCGTWCNVADGAKPGSGCDNSPTCAEPMGSEHSAELASPSPLPEGAWTHVAAVFSSVSGRTLLLNGSVVATESDAAAAAGATLKLPPADAPEDAHTPLVVGGSLERGAPAMLFGGELDDVRVWREAREVAQVARWKGQRLAGHQPNLVAYWRMDEGGGSDVHDMSGYGMALRLVGDAQWRTMPKLFGAAENYLRAGSVQEQPLGVLCRGREPTEFGASWAIPRGPLTLELDATAHDGSDTMRDAQRGVALRGGRLASVAATTADGIAVSLPAYDLGGPAENYAQKYSGAQCCRPACGGADTVLSDLIYPPGAASPSDCQATCDGSSDCNFFDHSTAWNNCVFCTKCDQKQTCGAANKYTAWAKVAGAAARRGAAEQVRLSTAVAGGACDAMNSQRYACRRKGKADVAYLAYDDATLSAAQVTHTTATWGADVWAKWGACKSHCDDGECVPLASGPLAAHCCAGGAAADAVPAEYTHAFWLKLDWPAGGVARERVLWHDGAGTACLTIDANYRAGVAKSGAAAVYAGTLPHGGGWQLLVAVGKGGSTAVYSATADAAPALVGTAAASCAGAHACQLGEWGKAPGAIAHAWAWPRALDAAEVAELHAATSRCYPKS